jgi:hypothetical protein
MTTKIKELNNVTLNTLYTLSQNLNIGFGIGNNGQIISVYGGRK